MLAARAVIGILGASRHHVRDSRSGSPGARPRRDSSQCSSPSKARAGPANGTGSGASPPKSLHFRPLDRLPLLQVLGRRFLVPIIITKGGCSFGSRPARSLQKEEGDVVALPRGGGGGASDSGRVVGGRRARRPAKERRSGARHDEPPG